MTKRTLHYFWEGGEKTRLVRKCLASWPRVMPDCAIMEWNLAKVQDLDVDDGWLTCSFAKEAIAAKKWGFVIDVVRWVVLWHVGGTFLDADVELVRPTPEGAWLSAENDNPLVVNPGQGVAFPPHHPFVRAVLETYAQMTFDLDNMIACASPHVITRMLGRKDVPRILSAKVMNPLGWSGGRLGKLSDECCAIHWYAASWFNWKQHLAYKVLPRLGIDVSGLVRWVRGRGYFWLLGGALVAMLFVAIDNLVSRLDWTYINFKGWVMYAVQLIPWTALLVAPALLFGKWSRWLYYPLVVILSVVEFATLFVRWQFKGQMNGTWVRILLDTTWREMLTFVGQSCGVSLGVILVLMLVLLVSALRTISRLRTVKPSRSAAVCGVLCLVLFLLMTPFCSSPIATLESRSSVFFISDALRNWEQYERLSHMSEHPELPEGLVRDARIDGSFHGVFVIGESATRQRWHSYGYARETTPCIDALGDEVIFFKDVCAAAIHTARAIPLLLTTATVEREGDLRFCLTQALAHLGYATSVFSNQERVGRFCGAGAAVFAGCEKSVFLPEQTSGSAPLDDALLPCLKFELSGSRVDRPAVSFLHLMGSHSPAEDKYPPSFNPFGARPVRSSRDRDDVALMSDHYDNSIAFTDMILGDIVEILKQQGGPAWMIYIPDHGESPNDKSWRTETSRDVWEIPMVVWFSSEYRDRFPDVVARVQEEASLRQRSDQLLDLFLVLAGAKVE